MCPFESAFIVCSFFTEPLNTAENHEQISGSSCSGEGSHRSDPAKGQGPDVTAGKTVKVVFPGPPGQSAIRGNSLKPWGMDILAAPT